MDQKEIDIIICNHEACLQFYNASNKFMFEYSKMACNGAMLLNGAAIIPILYSKSYIFYKLIIFFGSGAAAAVVGMCLSYLVQWIIVKIEELKLIDYPFRTRALTAGEARAAQAAFGLVRWLFWARSIAIGFVFLSLVLFGYGLYEAYPLLS